MWVGWTYRSHIWSQINLICDLVRFTHDDLNEFGGSLYPYKYFDLWEMKRVMENGLVHEVTKLASNFYVPRIKGIRNEESSLLGWRRVDWSTGIKSSEEPAASFLRVTHVLNLHGPVSQKTGILVISSLTTSDAQTGNI